MYITRDIDKTLLEWKTSSRRKPLLLRGVRQCGKTSAVRNLSSSFEYYLEVNLEKMTGLRKIFDEDLDAKRIISRLEVEISVPVIPGKTLIFIDEIQYCPRAITALRYFYEEVPDLHIIAAGSLLEFLFAEKKGDKRLEFPVGRVRSLFMYPFSFTEFLRGIGQNFACDYLMTPDVLLGKNDAHEKLLSLYKEFLVVGGMPEAVAEYAESRSFLSVQRIHRDIILNLTDDFSKYDSTLATEIIRKVFDYAIHHVCDQTKSSSAVAGVSAYYFTEALRLLQRAGLVFPVCPCTCESIPLGASEKQKNQKLLFFDCGIYLTECKLDIGRLLSAEVFDEMDRGCVVEMQTGLEIIKYSDAYSESSLYYWYRSGANAEVDYVIQKKENIIPIEVKASKSGSMQSLHAFLRMHPAVPYGIRVSMENFSAYEDIRVFPVYAVNRIIGD